MKTLKTLDEILEFLDKWADEAGGGYAISLAVPKRAANGECELDGRFQTHGNKFIRFSCLEALDRPEVDEYRCELRNMMPHRGRIPIRVEQ